MSPTNEKRSEYISILEVLDTKLSKLSDTTFLAVRDLDNKLEARFEKLEGQIERVEERITEKLELQVDNKLMQHQMNCQLKCQEQPKTGGFKNFGVKVIEELPGTLRYVVGLIAIISVFYSGSTKESEKSLQDFHKIDSIARTLEKPLQSPSDYTIPAKIDR